ncbi:hypothetical protein [Bovifimicola ammoniilytica]|jgi:hypothetical protein|nr:hypothetical protein [Bovifimicola ammoniilytica]MCU6752695.1 hypothetical protein [Bovifimicola ammoniilytica]CCZ03955.1 putative uncharacterized protein [Eubacterium sp. CAG:603]SCJ33533.1 Uncharacterised protein [uncultured Eubacterium sp.]
MEYMTIKETAEEWNLSVRRVQTICNEGMNICRIAHLLLRKL